MKNFDYYLFRIVFVVFIVLQLKSHLSGEHLEAILALAFVLIGYLGVRMFPKKK